MTGARGFHDGRNSRKRSWSSQAGSFCVIQANGENIFKCEQLFETRLVAESADVLCGLADWLMEQPGRGTLGASLHSAGQHASLPVVVVLFRHSCLISAVSSVGSILGLKKKEGEKNLFI